MLWKGPEETQATGDGTVAEDLYAHRLLGILAEMVKAATAWETEFSVRDNQQRGDKTHAKKCEPPQRQ